MTEHWTKWSVGYSNPKKLGGRQKLNAETWAELNWQTNSRMDERLTVASLEDELGQSRAEKRRSEMRKIQVEEALEQCLAQLRNENAQIYVKNRNDDI